MFEIELSKLKKLNTPVKIQDFLDSIPIDFDDNYKSPVRVIRENKAQCLESAVLAAACLKLNGEKPLLLDLKTARNDKDHVIALFLRSGRWGALSKTNHAVLGYREPVYKTVRELAMSYFHEYFLDNGRKTLRSFSRPLNLSRFDDKNWITTGKPLYFIYDALDRASHEQIASSDLIRTLRRASDVEIEAGKLVKWPRFPKNIPENQI